MADVAALCFLAAWFAVSVLGQFRGPLSDQLRAHDVAGLIPSFSFFAPNPARSDCHLVYRHVLSTSDVTGWTEAFHWQPTALRWLWNPDRRVEKAISDASSHLAQRKQADGVQWSTAYLLLLNHVSALPRPAGAVAVQFALLGSFGYDVHSAPFVRFVADTHPLDAPEPIAVARGEP